MKRLFLAGVAVATVLAAKPAAANGRFPESNAIFFSSTDDQIIVARTTFGFLVSHDRGATFDWVCEQALPLQNAEDPMVALTPAGKVIATTFSGVSVSQNGGCDWAFVGGDLDKQVFIDLAANPNDAKDVVVFASSYDKQLEDGGIVFTSKIWETKNEGADFTPIGTPLDPTLLGYTVDVTKTDPDRMYLSALRNPGPMAHGYILTSKNHGTSFTETEVTFQNGERGVFIGGVDPTNADRIYVRTSNGSDKPGRLLFSDDGAATFKPIYTGQGPLLGFALSADGSRVYVGGPKDGVQVANTSDHVFTQKSKVEIQCLASASDGLWACSNERNGFIVALSKDEGATFQKPTHFCDIKGPLACAAGSSVANECVSRWPTQRSTLGCDTLLPDGGLTDGGTGSDGGFPVEDNPLVEPGGGCDCRTSRATPFAALGSFAVVAAAVVSLLRRRR